MSGVKVDDDYVVVFIDQYPFYEENANMVTQKEALTTLAMNDGLTIEDFKNWFKWPTAFSGQIISWSNEVNY